MKANALSKSKISRPSSTLILKGVQMSKHKWKKEKTPPLETCNEILKEFMVVHKKQLTRYGGQLVKQVPKIDKIQEHPLH
jgi:hypothetical protein